eukprot:666064-Pyramimonas_sp.AAC.1
MYTSVPRAGLGLVQGTSTLHIKLAPGNPGCSQRWLLAFWTFAPLMYCTTHPEDAPGILHY